MKQKIGVLFSVLFILWMGAVASEDKPEKSKKKEDKTLPPLSHEVTVTATMYRKDVRDCSTSVNVVREEDLKGTSASNALNALSFLPGIFIQRTGDFGRADVDIRGLGQRTQRIQILVDGRPEKMGLFGCSVSHSFPLDNVSRIEVVKGPASVFYGSDALGGVVNILTKTPVPGFTTDFRASYGTHNTQQFTLGHGASLKKWHYYLSLDRRVSDGHIPNSQYAGNSMTGKIGFDWTEHLNVRIQGKYFQGKKSEPGPLSFPTPDYWNDYRRSAVDVSLNGKWDRDEGFLKIYRDFGHHEFSDGWHSRDFMNGAVLRLTTQRFANNELTVGAEFRSLGGKSYGFPQGSWHRQEAGIFLHNEHVFSNAWILSTGVRLNRDSAYGTEICPHLGIVYQLSERTLLRGVVNKGFRSPQISELFMYPTSNPDLKAEEVWNFEVGLDQNWGDWLYLNAAFFTMQGKNLIELGMNAFPPPMFKLLNSGKFHFQGAEMTLRADFSQNLSTYLAYSYFDPKEKTRGRPGQKLDFSLYLKNKSLWASLAAQYISDYYADDYSREPLPSYFVLNSRVEISLSSSFGLFLDLGNLLNKQYSIYVDLPGTAAGIYPMPRRTVNLGIRLRQ
ncbi:MAG: TonB-dependent receptor [Candidatus Aminicenantales bacterium]